MTVIIHYGNEKGPGWKSISDFDLDKEFENIKEDSISDFQIHHWYNTENIFIRVCLGVVRGEISYENVKFNYKGEIK